jgi:hypothetical protein
MEQRRKYIEGLTRTHGYTEKEAEAALVEARRKVRFNESQGE